MNQEIKEYISSDRLATFETMVMPVIEGAAIELGRGSLAALLHGFTKDELVLILGHYVLAAVKRGLGAAAEEPVQEVVSDPTKGLP